LYYPSTVSVGKAGDTIVVNLVSGSQTELYFTGAVYYAGTIGAHRVLWLTDGYKKLVDSLWAPAYRKTRAKSILEDALDTAGITDYTITVPDIEIKRFSTHALPVKETLDLLIKALEAHGVNGLSYFFDRNNTFRFGRIDDATLNEGPAVSLETKKDIIKRWPGCIQTLPVPVRHSEYITIDGQSVLTLNTELRVSRKTSRMNIWVV
jgi:hypothetical protein